MIGRMALAAALAASASTAWAQTNTQDESVERIKAARAAGVPLIADPIDLKQPSAAVWFKGEKPKDRLFAKATLRPLGGAVVTGDKPGNTPPVLLRAHAGDLAAMSTRGTASGAAAKIFCGKAGSNLIVCFEDADTDGMFDAIRRGIGGFDGRPEMLEIVGAPEPLPSPVAYRPAKPEELPSFDARIEQCGRDYDRPRFSFHVPGAEPPLDELLNGRIAPEQMMALINERGGFSGACEEPEPDRSPLSAALSPGAISVRMRDLVMEIGPKDKGAPTRLLGVGEPERLYRFQGRSLVPFAETVTPKQDALAAKQKFPKPTYAMTGDFKVEEGARGPGDVVLTAGFRHGYTGKLTVETKIRTLLSSRSLPAGTTLYGLPMQSSSYMTINGVPQTPFMGATRPTAANTNLVWCVPVQDEGKWSATCLPTQGGQRYTILKGQGPAFEVSSLSYDAGTSTNDGATPVAEQPADFGRPLAYRFRIKSVTPAAITLEQQTMFGDEAVNTRERAIERVAGRTSALLVGSGVVTFADAPDGKVVVAMRETAKAGRELSIESGVMRTELKAEPKDSATAAR